MIFITAHIICAALHFLLLYHIKSLTKAALSESQHLHVVSFRNPPLNPYLDHSCHFLASKFCYAKSLFSSTGTDMEPH